MLVAVIIMWSTSHHALVTRCARLRLWGVRGGSGREQKVPPEHQPSNVLGFTQTFTLFCCADRPPLRLRCLWCGCPTAAVPVGSGQPCSGQRPRPAEAMAALGLGTPAASLASPQLPEHQEQGAPSRALDPGSQRVFSSSSLCQASVAVLEIRLSWALKPAAVSEGCRDLAELISWRQYSFWRVPGNLYLPAKTGLLVVQMRLAWLHFGWWVFLPCCFCCHIEKFRMEFDPVHWNLKS